MANAVQKERQRKIIDYLKIKKFARTSDLVELLNYSDATIKRDLVSLENQKLIRRTRGGAMIVDKRKIDIPYLLKMDRFNENKNKIVLAKLANELLQDDKVIFIDSSSTALYLIDFLRNYKGLQIITNGLMTASLLSEYTDFPINVIGGLIVPKRFTINGSKAMSDIATYNADLAFVSCRGYDFIHGATEATEGEAYVKRAFRKQAQKIILLFTADKFNQTYMYQSLNNQQIDYIVTDYQFSENDLNLMCDYNIKVLATE